MMKIVLLAAVVALGVSLLVSQLSPGQAGAVAPAQESAYERILRTGQIRCGYASWEPVTIVNPNTGEVSGIAPDIMQEIARLLELEIVWTEEVGWGEYVTNLAQGRFDVFCAGPTPNVERARQLLFTEPFVYTNLQLFTQADNNQFDHNRVAINQPTTTLGALDGTTSFKILKAEFPQATFQSYPEVIPFSQVIVDVGEGKTDVTLQAAFAGALYMQANSGKLKVIPGFEELRVLENVYMVAGDEFKLRELLNEAIAELHVAGTIDAIIDRYETVPGTFPRVRPGYQ